MNIEVKKILNIINNNSYEAYIIGGYVRDYLLNIESYDYDICTNCPLKILTNILSNYKYTIYFDTLTIIVDNINIQITPYRKEFNYKNRHPEYINVSDLNTDLLRRDFTINTICMDSNNNIIDLLNGKNDLDNKIIRCIGDIDTKLTEDPLRILRALRFSIKHGFNIETMLKDKIIEYGYLLRNISYETKKKEIEYLIGYRRLDILKEYNLDKYLDINLDNIRYYDSNILVWMNIDYLNRYIVSRKDRKLIKDINELHGLGLTMYSIYKYGLYISSLVSELDNKDIKSIYDSLIIKNRKDININTSDILSIIDNKKDIENIYIDLEKNILEQRLDNDYNIIINYLNEKYK